MLPRLGADLRFTPVGAPTSIFEAFQRYPMVIALDEDGFSDLLRFLYLIDATDGSEVPSYQAERTESSPNLSRDRDVRAGDFV